MITDILERNSAKIITLFSISPGSKFTRNEIKEKTMLNNLPLDNALAALLKNKILVKEKRLLSINFESRMSMILLEAVRKEHLRFKEIPLKIFYLLDDASESFSKVNGIENIYLFGSYAKLIYTEKSDIDIAILLKKDDGELIKRIKDEIRKLEKKYGKVIQEHFFEKKDLKENDPIIKEIKKNGIQLF